ncbi:MAG: esterase-like activity of phytase family protein [Geminicoccaceae bacterium]|nr:esterase-like activity of phytase family protein [Geminicoccaceae bacterium]
MGHRSAWFDGPETGADAWAKGPAARPRRRRLAGLLALGWVLVALVGCVAESAIPSATPSVTISRLEVEPAGVRTAPGVELLLAFELTGDDPRFGGFSGIATDGRSLWLLSDRAVLWQAGLGLEELPRNLRLDGWRAGSIHRDTADRAALDSEALALDADGGLVVGFEQDGSLRRLEADGAGGWTTRRLHDGSLTGESPANRGLEAATGLGDGSFLVLSEGGRQAADIARGSRLGPDGSTPVTYGTARGFSPVGAAIAGDRLLVLERSVGVLTGWQTRVTVIGRQEWASAGPMAGPMVGEELLRIGAGPLAENYEGITSLDLGDGSRLLLLVADDNQSPLQRTLLLVFSWRGS